MKRALLALAITALAFVTACDVNEYCLNCATDDGGGGNGDGAMPDAIRDGGAMPDACVPTGAEVCDGLDNDCNGTPDDAVPTVGDTCGANVGVCTVGVIECHGADGLACSGDALQAPESCDDLDNDCDTVVDDGNPEGGARCGTDIGDCIAGVTMCITGGLIDCVGDSGTVGGADEECDGRDNDCDGNFDEGLPSMGSCGATDDGECEFGELMCVGGGQQCVGYVGPTFEECDTTTPLPLDSDCDGNDHNGYDLDHDVRNCGACQSSCIGTIDHATAGCSPMCVGGTNNGRSCTVAGNCPGGTCGGGGCVVGNCDPGFFDILPTGAAGVNEGCEYACTFAGPQEDCNLVDDNCNGSVDESLTPPPICITTGACGGTTATCEPIGSPATSAAWECDYTGGDVSLDGSGNITQESECDGVDNDCDGRVDEGDVQVFNRTSCADSAVGVCQKVGHYVCDPADEDAAPICSLNLAVPIVDSGGASPSAETCDGKDNDCDSLVDDSTLTITTIARAGNVVTVNTSTAGTVAVGQSVTIAGVTDATFNGTFTVASTPTSTQFTFAQVLGPASSSGGTVNQITAAARGSLQTWVSLGGGVSVMAYEASRPDAANPDAISVTISAITRATNTVTTTTATAHGLAVGNSVVIANVTNATFDGTFTVLTVPTATTFTYAQTAVNASSSAGTATRPAPTGFPLGTITSYPCSKANVQPWVNVKQPDAETACAAVGGRLCNEQEWHRACAGKTAQVYPVTEGSGTNNRTFIEAEDYITMTSATTAGTSENPNTTTGVLHTWVPDYSTSYSGISALRASPNNSVPTIAATGANVSSTNAPTQSPQLTYTFTTLGTATSRYVYVRMWTPSDAASGSSDNDNDSEIWVGINGFALQAIDSTTEDSWRWARTGAFALAASTTYTITIYMKEDGARIDQLMISRNNAESSTLSSPTSNGNDWTFGDTYATNTCNGEDNDGDVLPANAGDQDDVIATGAKASCFSDWGAQDVFDMSGNIKEWTKERFPASNPLRGGASNNEAAGMTCSNAFALADDEFFFNNVGFRCCK